MHEIIFYLTFIVRLYCDIESTVKRKKYMQKNMFVSIERHSGKFTYICITCHVLETIDVSTAVDGCVPFTTSTENL